ncbi:MAG: hypothetical protein ABSC06_09750 [Rhodopila sp.]|jgi:hypothetical protein
MSLRERAAFGERQTHDITFEPEFADYGARLSEVHTHGRSTWTGSPSARVTSGVTARSGPNLAVKVGEGAQSH